MNIFEEKISFAVFFEQDQYVKYPYTIWFLRHFFKSYTLVIILLKF